MMADDLGYADLSCYGRKDYKTPNIDRLASQGVKLMNAYAIAPLCTPTRVGFMTGRYPARHPLGLIEPMEWSKKDSMIGLAGDRPTIASRMKEAGYETYLVGKWHLGFKPEFGPLKNGFDYFFGFNGGGIDYASHRSPRNGAADLYENETAVTVPGYMTDLLRTKAIELISRPHKKPYFLTLMFNAPHWPWQGPLDAAYPDTTNWRQGGSASTYAAMMASLDEAVGAIVEAVERSGAASNTVIIFTSDNGGERFSDMGGYRGNKSQLWDGGIRVPAIVRWDKRIAPGSVSNQVVSTLDWVATISSLARMQPSSFFQPDGMDVMPVLTGKKKETERTIYWRSFQRIKHKAMRDGKWKYMQDEKGNEYLFDLASDPGEKNDLRATNPGVFEKLKAKYAKWESEMLEPVALK